MDELNDIDAAFDEIDDAIDDDAVTTTTAYGEDEDDAPDYDDFSE